MDLAELRIQNFGAIKSAHLYLENKGLVSVSGENRDGTGATSNGSGKSTIINAILWNAFGDAGKKISVDTVVNEKIGKDCFVETLYKDTDAWYLITRFRKHKVFKNAITIQTSSTKGETWSDITKAGKIVQEQINDILGCDQKTFEAYCFARQDDAPDIPAMTDSELKGLLERTLPFDDLDSCYKVASKNYNDANKAYADLNVRYNQACMQESFHKENGKRLVEKSKNYVIEVAEHNEAIETEIIALEDFLKSNTVRDLEKLNKEALEWEAIATSIDLREYYGVLNRLEQIAEEIVELGVEKTNLKNDAQCHACGTVLSDPSVAIHRLDDKIKALQEERKSNERRLVNLKAFHERKIQAENKFREISNEISAAHADEKRSDKLKAKIAELNASKKDIGDNPYTSLARQTADEFKKAKAVKHKLLEEVEASERNLKVLEGVQKLYSPSGVRYYLLETVTPYLNERTNYYLNQLTDGAIKAIWSTVTKLASGEYREKFSIEIKMRNLNEYGALSGGEKRKVKLACFFALQDLIASRATKPINIWCGDEIDHALDLAGLERLMCVLNEKTKVKSTILVISHNELRDWIPNYATVIRENDVSSVEGFLNAA